MKLKFSEVFKAGMSYMHDEGTPYDYYCSKRSTLKQAWIQTGEQSRKAMRQYEYEYAIRKLKSN